MLRLTVPVVIGELGWVFMGVVDTMMVGRISPEAIGAVSVGNMLFFTVAVLGMGMMLGLDALVPQAFGAKDIDACHRWLFQSLYGIVLVTPPLMLAVHGALAFLGYWGLEPNVYALAIPYTRAANWGMMPLLVMLAFECYLRGMGLVKPIMITLVSANLINVFANWLLIFGNWGFPEMGAEGAGWASCISRIYMAVMLAAYAGYHTLRFGTGMFRVRRALDRVLLTRLAKLGLPAALQRMLEVGVFAIATGLVGRLDAVVLAAHQVTLQAASITYMVPLGISAAASVRVGQAIGRGKPDAARRAGWTAIFLGAAFMAVAGVVFFSVPDVILRAFTDNKAVIAAGISLFYMAALFQLFDGVQAVATGAMRGAAETKTPMLANLIGHWAIGLPIGYYLCYELGWGATGIWFGLSLGLIFVALYLLRAWTHLKLRVALSDH